jgi:hypothetical protein
VTLHNDKSLRGQIWRCEECGKRFGPYRKKQGFCSDECRLATSEGPKNAGKLPETGL